MSAIHIEGLQRLKGRTALIVECHNFAVACRLGQIFFGSPSYGTKEAIIVRLLAQRELP